MFDAVAAEFQRQSRIQRSTYRCDVSLVQVETLSAGSKTKVTATRETVVMHALIIEDELLIAWDLKALLEDMGYTVAIAATEVAAVEAAGRRWPDLISADYKLAAGTGVGAVRTICAERNTAVVYVTASAPEVVRATVGRAIVVEKPCSPAQLADGVRRALAQWRAES